MKTSVFILTSIIFLEPELEAAQQEVEQLRQEVEKLKKYGENYFVMCIHETITIPHSLGSFFFLLRLFQHALCERQGTP